MSAIEFEGQIGPPGPQGEKGDKGDQGDQGDQGEVGTVWTPTLNLPLTSVADWAMPAGWTNDGAKMIAGTGASQIRNKYANRVPQDCFLTSLEIQVPGSSRSAADQRAGIQLDWDGANTGSATYLLKWVNLASGSAYNERDAVAAGVTVAVPGGSRSTRGTSCAYSARAWPRRCSSTASTSPRPGSTPTRAVRSSTRSSASTPSTSMRGSATSRCGGSRSRDSDLRPR